MNRTELQQELELHTQCLGSRGIEVDRPEVAAVASPEEVDEVEAALGISIPPTLRHAFLSIASGVRWSWRTVDGHEFDDPFSGIFSGGLDWSLHNLCDQHRGYLEWVEQCFVDEADPYDMVWHHKLGLAAVPNGDVIAVDLEPRRLGAIVYLSHDDGEGHGFMLASSLEDLLDRWVPLACPGPEDWQWLPFVPYDLGPIDPASANGVTWRQLVGLTAAPPRTAPSAPNDELFDELATRYWAASGSPDRYWVAHRALRVCSSDRADAVVKLLASPDVGVQELAAQTLGRWRWSGATDELRNLALTGTHNARLAALQALRGMPGDDAAAAMAELRQLLDSTWCRLLD